MTVVLNDRETDVLKRALDAYLTQLKEEASRTEQREAREEIWRYEKDLEALRSKL